MSIKMCGWSNGGFAPVHMNSFTRTLIVGIPGSLWKWGMECSAIVWDPSLTTRSLSTSSLAPPARDRSNRHDVHLDLELVAAGREDHAFDRRRVGIVAPPCHLDVVIVDGERICRIEVDPAHRPPAP